MLIEHFTQASCPPCATTNPIIFPIIEANHDRVATISYQVSWPGEDPMNKHNPSEVRNRVTYYGVQGVPGTSLNGNLGASSLSTVTQANIDAVKVQPASFDLDLQVEPYVNFQGLDIEFTMNASANVSGNLVAHVVVVEDRVNFSSPPGTNGEKEFHYVMKKMLPNSRGTDISSDWTAGQSEKLTFSYEFENFYDWQQAGVVAFIQDDNTKQIMQAVYWEPHFEANEGDDVLVSAASVSGNLNADFDIVCGGQASPKVAIMNSGETSLTSAKIEYSINGSATSSYTWSGNLSSFSETVVQLPEITFPIDFVGEMDVFVSQPNGNADNYPDNGKLVSAFALSPNSTTKAVFQIKPLVRPNDLSFRILNSSGDVIVEDGPFSQRTEQEYELNLNENECYTIEINNSYASINGSYRIEDESGRRVVSGTISNQGISKEEFGTFVAVSADDLASVNEWSVSPNPFVSELKIDVDFNTQVELDVIVTDLLGATVHSDVLQGDKSQSMKLDLSNLNSGVYFVTLRNGNELSTKKVIKK